MRRIFFSVICALVLPLFIELFAPAAARPQEAEKELIAKGQYIFSLAGGCACHTAPKGPPDAGGREIPIPMAKIYSTNLTADKETGLGGWSDQEIRDAMVKGIRPNGEQLIPAMPYEAYSGMAEEDLKALIVYLRTLKPVRKENLRPKAHIALFRPVVTPLWLKLFGRFSVPPPKAPQSGIQRGRYLVEHVSLCDDCHTPRNLFMAPRRALYLAGSKVGILGKEIPNITPDKETGIGEWSRNDIAEFLMTGTKPDLDNVQGLMAEVIEAGYKHMKREDALAIADYLKSIPPIVNKIK